ncbi:hypothetical protein ACFC1W_06205 [Microbacterium sp. NPDC056003]|jgi:hypothetical protein|uniref:hypothetical protein n=1 Tax=Microbacterium sp. NPDC056003 TaxID=3345676 RepID=UPI0035DA452E
MRIGENLCFARSALALQIAALSILVSIDSDDDWPSGDGFGLTQATRLRALTDSLELVEVALRIWAGMPWSEIAAYRGYQSRAAPGKDVPSRQAMQQKFGDGVAEVIRLASARPEDLLLYLDASNFMFISDESVYASDDRYLPELIQDAFPDYDRGRVLRVIQSQAEIWEARQRSRTKWWWDKSPNRLS